MARTQTKSIHNPASNQQRELRSRKHKIIAKSPVIAKQIKPVNKRSARLHKINIAIEKINTRNSKKPKQIVTQSITLKKVEKPKKQSNKTIKSSRQKDPKSSVRVRFQNKVAIAKISKVAKQAQKQKNETQQKQPSTYKDSLKSILKQKVQSKSKSKKKTTSKSTPKPRKTTKVVVKQIDVSLLPQKKQRKPSRYLAIRQSTMNQSKDIVLNKKSPLKSPPKTQISMYIPIQTKNILNVKHQQRPSLDISNQQTPVLPDLPVSIDLPLVQQVSVKHQAKIQPPLIRTNKSIQQLQRIIKSRNQRIFLLKAERGDNNWKFQVKGTKGNAYNLTFACNLKISCACIDFRFKQKTCKHIYFIVTQVLRNQNNTILEQLNKKPYLKQSTYIRLDQMLVSRLKERLSGTVKQQIDLKDDSNCVICFSEMQKAVQRLEQCQSCHKYFHSLCLSTWKKHNPTCPLCRGPLTGGSKDPLKMLGNVVI